MSQKNYTDRDVETVREIIATMERDGTFPLTIARAVLTTLDNAGRITPPWEPCQREDIRAGDRYRVDGEFGASEFVATHDLGPDSDKATRYYRIPAPAVEWPTERGPYLVTWKRHGEKYGPTWFVSDGETLWGTDKTFLHPESTEGDLTLLSVKKGGTSE